MRIGNAISLNMIRDFPVAINVHEITSSEVMTITDGNVESVVGHAETARVFGNLLGINLPMNRVTIEIKRNDSMIIGQYIGPRLPEGATDLPEGAVIKWLFVEIK